MATKSTRPVTRETGAMVREKGRLRFVMVTITGSVLELRAKGLRSCEPLDIGFCYLAAVKQRVMRERAERKMARKQRR